MRLETVCYRKLSIALSTPECLDAEMNDVDMFTDVLGVGETGVALRTFEWFLTTVCAYVTDEHVVSKELFATFSTHVSLGERRLEVITKIICRFI